VLTHNQIEDQGLIERYVRHQLPPEESAAVEEHYFHCDECFESVQITQKFVAGVRHAARKGLLDLPRETAGWLFPAFGVAAAAAIVLTIGLGWLWFVRLPESEAKLSAAVAQTRLDQSRISELDQRAALDRVPEPNVPVVILTAERAAGASSQLTLNNSTSRSVLLWIDAPQSAAGARFHVVVSGDNNISKSIDGVVRNSNGALAVGLPSSELPDGDYTVRVFRDNERGALLGEYRLKIARH
jgi:anti-sigma factor RsiW